MKNVCYLVYNVDIFCINVDWLYIVIIKLEFYVGFGESWYIFVYSGYL